MSAASRFVLFFAIPILILSSQASILPTLVDSSQGASAGVWDRDADAPTAGQPDDSGDVIEVLNPSPLALSSSTAHESLGRADSSFLRARTIAPLEQPPRPS